MIVRSLHVRVEGTVACPWERTSDTKEMGLLISQDY